MGFNKGDIVVCIKLDDSGHLELNQRYEIYDSIEMSDQHIVQISKLGFYSSDNFIPLIEWRKNKISHILNNG